MGEPSDEAFDLACEIVHGNAGPGNAAKMIDEALQAAELRGAELVERVKVLEKINAFAVHHVACALYQASYAVTLPSCSCGLERLRAALKDTSHD